MVETRRSKAELRLVLRQRRAALTPSQQRAAATALRDRVTGLPAWAGARQIAIYFASDGEIDAEPLGTKARSAGKQLFLPVIADGPSLEFARWDAGVKLADNRYGIPEPPAATARSPLSELDIVFVPLVGWDLFCNRLGMGGGFYDRTLSQSPGPLLVGLAHECQRVDELPGDSWDVRMDYIATESALYRRRGKGLKAEVLLGDYDPGL